MTVRNFDSVLSFFTDKDIPLSVRFIMPTTCLLSILGSFAFYSSLPSIHILTLPYKAPPGVYFYQFPSGQDTIITLKHLSIPIAFFIGGILTGVLCFIPPLRKNADHLHWGIISCYLILAFSLGLILTIQLILTEIKQSGVLVLLCNIIPITLLVFAVWVLSIFGVLLLLMLPQIGGLMIGRIITTKRVKKNSGGHLH